jgi:transketolase
VNIFTLKPLDRELVAACAAKTGAIVTAENHSIINGLGSAVAEVIAEGAPAQLERVGVRDEFGEVGPVDYLRKRFKLNAEEIAARAKMAISRKN